MKNRLLSGIGLLIAFSCFFTTTSFAQKDSTLTEKVSKAFCDEFTKKDLSKIKPDALDIEMGMVVLQVIGKYKKEIKKEWDLSIDKEEDMEKIGYKIGAEAALSCPAFSEYIMNNMDLIGGDEDEEKTITGNFIQLNTGQFSYIIVKSKGGKEDKYWWFAHFPGADELILNAEQFRSKTVSVKYRVQEIYDVTLKEYREIKILTKLALEE